MYSDLIAMGHQWSISGDAEEGQGTGKGTWFRLGLRNRSGSWQGQWCHSSAMTKDTWEWDRELGADTEPES